MPSETPSPELREAVSALADGQLRGDAFARTVDAVAEQAEAHDAWRTYHLIGDVLRSGVPAQTRDDDAFMARLRGAIAAEPVPPRVLPMPSQEPVQALATPLAARAPASNQPNFRWAAVAGLAGVAMVAALVWQSGVGRDSGAQLASAPAEGSVLVPQRTQSGDTQLVIRDPRLDELLAAHRQTGGASVLQMPAGFLRNATFEGPAR